MKNKNRHSRDRRTKTVIRAKDGAGLCQSGVLVPEHEQPKNRKQISPMNLTINSQRLSSELEKLATFTDTPNPSVTRILYTDTDLKARAYFKQLATDAGFTVREDPVGNTFVRFQGSDPSLPAVGTGSHIDAIPHAGRFDGTVGVLGGLEALRALRSANFQPRHSLEVLMFTS